MLIASCGSENDGIAKEMLRSVEQSLQRIPAAATLSTSVDTTIDLSTHEPYSSTHSDPPTQVTITNTHSECNDIATHFAFRYDLCAGAGDPESYLGLARPRYTCVGSLRRASTIREPVLPLWM